MSESASASAAALGSEAKAGIKINEIELRESPSDLLFAMRMKTRWPRLSWSGWRGLDANPDAYTSIPKASRVFQHRDVFVTESSHRPLLSSSYLLVAHPGNRVIFSVTTISLSSGFLRSLNDHDRVSSELLRFR